MTNENIGSAVDPLAEAAGGINTDFPVLMPDRLLEFKVSSAKKKHNEQTGSDSIELKIELTKDSTFRDNNKARAGFKFNQYIGVSPSDNYTFEDIKRNVALWIKACLGKEKAAVTQVRHVVDNPSILEGTIFNGRTGVKKDKTGTYADSTSVTPILPA